MGVPAQSSENTNTGRHDAKQATAIGVGAELRDARERRALSLDQLSRSTKISVTILRSIEANQLEKLPQAVFLRGFLRAYARQVGLDPEETVRRYLRQFQPADDAANTPPAELKRPRPESARLAGHTTHRVGVDLRSVRAQWFVIAVVALVIGYATLGWRAHAPDMADHRAQSTEISQPIAPAVSTAATTRPETGTAGVVATAATGAAPDALHIAIHAQGLCWVSATADGRRVAYRVMQPGEEQTIEVHDEAVLRVGEPAAFSFSIDGTEGRALGRAGTPVTVHITKENYRNFLRQ
jgi:cytoskeleton protein RodZ